MALHVFGYGSLLYQPPARLAARQPATVSGLVRAFNKRSHPRGCLHEAALMPEGLEGWSTPTRRASLALGTRELEGGEILGQVLTWREEDAAEVLAELDRREGVRGLPDDGYRRVRMVVGGLETWVYCTAEGPWFEGGLGVEETARVLVHATPVVPGDRALGADYLAGAVGVVRWMGGEDAVLEALAGAVRGLLPGGRWEAGCARFGVDSGL